MYTEDECLPISALQHLLFCERQCALIHIEGLWAENRLTVEGRRLHDKTHGGKKGPRGGGMAETRCGVRTVRSLPLLSLRLGIAGVADVVEFLPASAAESFIGSGAETKLAPLARLGTPLPVEYKRGKPKKLNWDRVQVCAQALCIEEMLGAAVPEAAIFYGAIRHRECVALDRALRAETEAAAARLHELIAAGVSPPAIFEKKCQRCSLIDLCLPRVTTGTRSASRYLHRALQTVTEEPDGELA